MDWVATFDTQGTFTVKSDLSLTSNNTDHHQVAYYGCDLTLSKTQQLFGIKNELILSICATDCYSVVKTKQLAIFLLLAKSLDLLVLSKYSWLLDTPVPNEVAGKCIFYSDVCALALFVLLHTSKLQTNS